MRFLKYRLARILLILVALVGAIEMTSVIGRAGGGDAGICLVVYSMEATNCPGEQACGPGDPNCEAMNQEARACQNAAADRYWRCMGATQ